MERTHPACGTLASCQHSSVKKERAGCRHSQDFWNRAARARVETLKSFRRTLYMTRNKLTLMMGLILGGGLLAGGITYAQALDSPFAEAQEPGSTAQTFSFFVDGAFLGAAG